MNIKRCVFFLCVFFTCYRSPGQIWIGPSAGGQLSWVRHSEAGNRSFFRMKPFVSYHAGLGLSFRVRNRFFLTSSFLYSVKGKNIEGKLDENLRHHARYHFIDVPILYSVDFKARLGANNEFKYFIGIGPEISYWLGGKGTLYTSDFHENGRPELEYKITFYSGENGVDENEMAVSEPNRLQLGLNLATGMSVEPLPHHRFIFMLRYAFGHSFFSKEEDGHFTDTYYQDDLQSRNLGIRVSVFYMIDTRTRERKKGKSTIKQNRMR